MGLSYLREISNTWAAESWGLSSSTLPAPILPRWTQHTQLNNKLQLFHLHRSLGIEKAKTYLRFFILIGSSSFASSAASCSSLTVTDFNKTSDFLSMKIFKLMSENSCTNQGHVQQLCSVMWLSVTFRVTQWESGDFSHLEIRNDKHWALIFRGKQLWLNTLVKHIWSYLITCTLLSSNYKANMSSRTIS